MLIMVIELRPGSEMGIAVKGSKSSRQPNFFIVQGILTFLITKQLSLKPLLVRNKNKTGEAKKVKPVFTLPHILIFH